MALLPAGSDGADPRHGPDGVRQYAPPKPGALSATCLESERRSILGSGVGSACARAAPCRATEWRQSPRQVPLSRSADACCRRGQRTDSQPSASRDSPRASDSRQLCQARRSVGTRYRSSHVFSVWGVVGSCCIGSTPFLRRHRNCSRSLDRCWHSETESHLRGAAPVATALRPVFKGFSNRNRSSEGRLLTRKSSAHLLATRPSPLAPSPRSAAPRPP